MWSIHTKLEAQPLKTDSTATAGLQTVQALKGIKTKNSYCGRSAEYGERCDIPCSLGKYPHFHPKMYPNVSAIQQVDEVIVQSQLLTCVRAVSNTQQKQTWIVINTINKFLMVLLQ